MRAGIRAAFRMKSTRSTGKGERRKARDAHGYSGNASQMRSAVSGRQRRGSDPEAPTALLAAHQHHSIGEPCDERAPDNAQSPLGTPTISEAVPRTATSSREACMPQNAHEARLHEHSAVVMPLVASTAPTGPVLEDGSGAPAAILNPVDFGFGRVTFERHPELGLPRMSITFARKSIDTTGIAQMLGAIDAVLALAQPFSILFDARSCTLPSRSHTRLVSEWTRKNWTQLEQLVGGFAILLSSLVMRSTVNMLISVGRPTQPHGVFTKDRDAFAFARDKCTATGVSPAVCKTSCTRASVRVRGSAHAGKCNTKPVTKASTVRVAQAHTVPTGASQDTSAYTSGLAITPSTLLPSEYVPTEPMGSDETDSIRVTSAPAGAESGPPCERRAVCGPHLAGWRQRTQARPRSRHSTLVPHSCGHWNMCRRLLICCGNSTNLRRLKEEDDEGEGVSLSPKAAPELKVSQVEAKAVPFY